MLVILLLLFCLIKSGQQPDGPPAPPDVSATPFGLGGLGGLPGLGGLGMGSVNFMEMQQRMQREVCFNIEKQMVYLTDPISGVLTDVGGV